jgi:hypothetical protein
MWRSGRACNVCLCWSSLELSTLNVDIRMRRDESLLFLGRRSLEKAMERSPKVLPLILDLLQHIQALRAYTAVTPL